MNIRNKILVSLPATLCVVAMTTWFVSYRDFQAEVGKIRAQEEGFLDVVQSRAQGYAIHAATVLEQLSTNHLLKEQLAEHNYTFLDRRLEEVLRTHNSYFQARWIDQSGKEQIRWQRNSQRVFKVPQSELQNKSGRYYVKEALAADYGQIYFSRIDLNEEGGQIQKPFHPTLRIATRLFDAQGNPRGLLVINDDLTEFLGNWSSYITNSVHLFTSQGADWSKIYQPDSGWQFVPNDELERTINTELFSWREAHNESIKSGFQQSGQGLFIWRSTSLGEYGTGLTNNSYVNTPEAHWISYINPEALTSIQWQTTRDAASLILPAGIAIWVLYILMSLRQRRLDEAEQQLNWSTQKLKASSELLKANRKIEEMINHNVNGFLIVNRNGVIQTCNSALASLFGYHRFDLIGSAVDMLVPKGIAGQHPGFVSRYMANPTTGSMAKRRHIQGLHKSGELIDIEISLSPLPVIEGGELEIAATVIDISERILMTRRIERYACAFMEAGEAMIILDSELKIQHVNQAFQNVTGFSTGEVLGQSSEIFLQKIHQSDYYSTSWRATTTQDYWNGNHIAQHKNGSTFPIKLHVRSVRTTDGQLDYYVMSFVDITDLDESNKKLERLALYDSLTGLPNRTLLERSVETAIVRANRRRNKFALFFIDLDNFKYINDGLGHHAGDQLLIKVGELLKHSLRSEDTVARLGGDEFVVIAEELEDRESIMQVSHKVMKELDIPFKVRDESVRVTASMGICIYPDDGLDYDTLLKKADSAMYLAKDSGKASFHFFEKQYDKQYANLLRLDFELHQAIASGDLHLVYQPQFAIASGELIGMEALVRWNHPHRGLLMPVDFLQIAEQMGLLPMMESHIMRKACQQAAEWNKQGIPFGKIAVNVSGAQIHTGGLRKELTEALLESDCNPTDIEVEITEAFIVQSGEKSLEELNAIRHMGMTIAIDDFGTGYSSLSYLKDLPIDKLKIDKSFIDDLPEDRGSAKIITALIAMAKGLNIELIAEGVESQEQLDYLARKGCDQVQGFLTGKPMAKEYIEGMLKNHDNKVVPFKRS